MPSSVVKVGKNIIVKSTERPTGASTSQRMPLNRVPMYHLLQMVVPHIALGCHFCEDAFFSSEGWKKHNSQKHGETNRSEYVSEDAVEPGTYVPSSAAALPTDLILAEVKEEEKTAIEQAAGISSGVDLHMEPEFSEDIMEV